jgi:hypothetical protein
LENALVYSGGVLLILDLSVDVQLDLSIAYTTGQFSSSVTPARRALDLESCMFDGFEGTAQNQVSRKSFGRNNDDGAQAWKNRGSGRALCMYKT